MRWDAGARVGRQWRPPLLLRMLLLSSPSLPSAAANGGASCSQRDSGSRGATPLDCLSFSLVLDFPTNSFKPYKTQWQRTTNTVTYIDNKIKYSIIFLRNMLLFHFINKAITLVQNLRSTNNKYSYLYRQQDKILHYISLKYAFIPFYK
jgi:hypothetical protein